MIIILNKGEFQHLSVTKAFRRVIPLVIRVSPLFAIAALVNSILTGVLLGIVPPLMQRIFDAITDLAMGQGTARAVYTSAAIVAVVLLIRQVIDEFGYLYNLEVTGRKFELALYKVILQKIVTLPAKMFEDKTKLDDIEKSSAGRWGSGSMYKSVCDVLFTYGLYLVIVGMYLWSLEPVLVFSLVLVFIPVMLSQMFEANYHAVLENSIAPLRRQRTHYTECLVGAKFAKETRLFGAYHFFRHLFMDCFLLIQKKEWDTEKKVQALHLGLNIVKGIGWGGILLLLLRSLNQGTISVGAFAAVFGAIGMMFSMCQQLFNRFSYSVSQQLGHIHNMLNLLDMKVEAQGTGTPDFAKGIQAENVTFAYPQSEKNAVDGVSITIRPGETLALVGENGSGKTTLVKLLCGLYKPDGGKVSIGGCDSSHTGDASLYSKTTGVFQNYNNYIFTLDENVRLSETASTKEPHKAMEDADVDYKDTATFPDGIHTKLSREFEGVDLSGGQWQRVATARGLYRNYDFIVLDEPTAAIDPIEETRLYKKYAELTKGKIALLVTHRLGSVRIADRIAVMEGGKIVETGTHESLLAAKGVYAKMWAAQAESYG